MSVKGGEVIFQFKSDDKDLQKSVNDMGTSIKKMVTALGLDKLISKTMSALNNSLDGAIKRVDTLNNFPRVMSNLGIATEEATEAVNELSDGLTGLPTTLNDGVSAVQRFTSQNNDVKKSTKIFLALNNAILAGGASMELQSSALEQLSQAYAKGKPDAMEWRSMLTAMPAQLKQVAKAMGYTSTAVGGDLYTAIQKGKVSMDDFMDTIVKLNTEGVGEFASFEEQAKASTGGIATSITNVKTAITRGLANSIEALNKALKKVNLPTVSEMIQNFGKSISKAFSKVNEAIGKINFQKLLPVFKDVINYMKNLKNTMLGFVKEVFKKIDWDMVLNIAPTVLKIVGTIKVLNPLIKTGTSLISALINGIKGFTNPLKLATTGVMLYVSAIETALSVLNYYGAGLQGVTKEARDQQREWENLKEARQQALDGYSAEIKTIETLKSSLALIVDENGKVKEGYEERAKYILGELNKALGTEYELNGNIIENYQDMQKEIDNLIQKKKIELTLKAYEAEYQQALTKQSEATKTLAKLRGEYNETLKKTASNAQEAKKKEIELNHIGSLIKDQTKLIGEYGYTIENYDNLTQASISGTAEEVQTALDKMGVSYDEAKQKVNTSLTEQIESQQNYVSLLKQSLEDAKKNNDKYQEDILKKQIETEEKSLNSLRENLVNETSAVTELSEAQIQAWSNLANSDYEAYNKYLSKIPPETRQKIEDATGIVSRDTSLKTAVGELSNEANASYLFDPSQKTAIALSNTASAISNNTSVSAESNNLASKISTPFTSLNGYSWGSDLGLNIASGIRSRIGLVSGASQGIAQAIKATIGHSVPKKGPLKDELTYMPDMVSNLTKTLEASTPNLYSSISKMAGKMKDQLSLGFGMSPTLNNTASYNPSVNVTVYNNMETDFMGNLVSNIKTFSNGSKNDYNYGMGG